MQTNPPEAIAVLDFPNVSSVWLDIAHNTSFEAGLDAARLRMALRADARRRYGDQTCLSAKAFKNRWPGNRSVEQMILRRLRSAGWRVFVKPKDIAAKSDIDEDIVVYTLEAAYNPNVKLVYLIGNDLRNYLPLARHLMAIGVEVVLVCFPGMFMPRTMEGGLGVETLDIQSLDGVFREGLILDFNYNFLSKRPKYPHRRRTLELAIEEQLSA